MPEHVLAGRTLAIFLCLFGYALFRWGLMKLTHEYRVAVGREAVRWSADRRVSDEARDLLRSMAGTMYRPLVPWVLALALLATSIVSFEGVVPSEDADVGERACRLYPRVLVAHLTTSPLACLRRGPGGLRRRFPVLRFGACVHGHDSGGRQGVVPDSLRQGGCCGTKLSV